MNDLQQTIEARRALGVAVCQRITETIVKLGYALRDDIGVPRFEQARFELVTDPYSQSRDLVGFWHDLDQQRIGQIRFHGDGTFFAEYDIVRPHPSKPDCFVEAINAWGNAGKISSEAKLLAMASD